MKSITYKYDQYLNQAYSCMCLVVMESLVLDIDQLIVLENISDLEK